MPAARASSPPAGVASAWRAYLAATRGLERERYEEAEPWAWTRLQTRLRRAAADAERRASAA
jgi:hypothetical protein